MKSIACCALIASLLGFAVAQAADTPRSVLKADPELPEDTEKSFKSLDAKVQRLKQDMLMLNRDIQLLEEDVFFPPNSRVTVFLALSVDASFTLNSVSLKIEDQQVGDYQYGEVENGALKSGGAQRLQRLNLRPGQHLLSAGLVGHFTDRKGNTRQYQRTTSMTIDKHSDPTWVVLQLDGQPGDLQPRFAAREWKPES